MFWKRTFRQLRWAKMANQPSDPHDDISKQMNPTAAWMQKLTKHWEHCAAYNLRRTLWRRKDEQRTIYATKRKCNGSRIMCRERPLWQGCELKMCRQQLCKSRKMWEMLKRRDQQPESLKKYIGRCWLLLETVWGSLRVPMMERMRKMRKRMNQIESSASWAKMMIPAGWWHYLQNRTPTHGWWLTGADEAWQIHATGMGGRVRPRPCDRYEVRDGGIECSSNCSAGNKQGCSCTCTNIMWRAYADKCCHPWTIANAARDFSTMM